jgi:hypothetical protein
MSCRVTKMTAEDTTMTPSIHLFLHDHLASAGSSPGVHQEGVVQLLGKTLSSVRYLDGTEKGMVEVFFDVVDPARRWVVHTYRARMQGGRCHLSWPDFERTLLLHRPPTLLPSVRMQHWEEMDVERISGEESKAAARNYRSPEYDERYPEKCLPQDLLARLEQDKEWRDQEGFTWGWRMLSAHVGAEGALKISVAGIYWGHGYDIFL